MRLNEANNSLIEANNSLIQWYTVEYSGIQWCIQCHSGVYSASVVYTVASTHYPVYPSTHYPGTTPPVPTTALGDTVGAGARGQQSLVHQASFG